MSMPSIPYPLRGAAALSAVAAMLTGGCAGTGGVTVDDEIQAGAEVAQQVQQQIGLYTDGHLRNYVDAVGRRLVAELGNTPYQFSFRIIDQPEPNAFATPGGYIYLSRGILALINSEDELAGILAHEISHVTGRHHARQAERAVLPGLLELPGQVIGSVVSEDVGAMINTPIHRAGQMYMASFSRSQESEADTAGMQLAARAGYDPAALAEALTTLEQTVVALTGEPHRAGFFDTHPTTPDRVANIERHARGLEWRPAKPFAASRQALYSRLDGLYWGRNNPQQGIFDGQSFIQPDMGFTITFPDGWTTINTPVFVGAVEPEDQAMMVLGSAGPIAPPKAYADAFVAELDKELGVTPDEVAAAKLGDWPAHFVRIRDLSGHQPASIYYVWVRADTSMFQFVAAGLESHTETMRQAGLSLRNISAEEREAVTVERMRIATAAAGETIASLSDRTGNLWPDDLTLAVNGRADGGSLEAGAPIKILQREPYY